MSAYYNEIDPLKAEVLREAIKAGVIALGDVDERSIADVEPDELMGYAQCHFFAGGGFWSLALRWAGWPDDRPVWTGSCPCPSFSAAGKGGGFDDPRHLWPHWGELIRQCKPAIVFGEQADDAVGYGWVDLVQTDLEAAAYAFGKIVFGACSVGAPHIRQRLYFCAHAEHSELLQTIGSDDAVGLGRGTRRHDDPCNEWKQSDSTCISSVGANTAAARPFPGAQRGIYGSEESPGTRAGEPERPCDAGDGIDANRDGSFARWQASAPMGYRSAPHAAGSACGSDDAEREGLQGHAGDEREWRGSGWLDPQQARSIAKTGATRGFWADCDWWYGRDDRYRPIGPGLFPLAHGSPARVGRLRMFGDGIVVTQAQAFIEAYAESRGLTL